jgi:predicted ester cyclase
VGFATRQQQSKFAEMKFMKSLMVRCLLSLICSCLLLVTKSQQPAEQEEQNKNLVMKMNSLFNEGKAAEATAFYSDSLTRGAIINGKPAFIAFQEDILATFPDVQTKILELWADGDWVIAKCIFSGTHQGVATLPHHGAALVGATPTNKKFSVNHIRMYKIREGRIVARQAVRDDLGMLQQLGLLGTR